MAPTKVLRIYHPNQLHHTLALGLLLVFVQTVFTQDLNIVPLKAVTQEPSTNYLGTKTNLSFATFVGSTPKPHLSDNASSSTTSSITLVNNVPSSNLVNKTINNNIATTSPVSNLSTVTINKDSLEVNQSLAITEKAINAATTKTIFVNNISLPTVPVQVRTELPINLYDTCGTGILPDHLQPVYSRYARIKKCCKLGENFEDKNDTHICSPENVKFEPVTINAVFYDNCIEEDGTVELDIEPGNICDGLDSMVYDLGQGDLLYVLQNGSLLHIDSNRNEFYDVFEVYCLDMNRYTNSLQAIVCNQTIGSMIHVSKAESLIYAICMYYFFLLS